MAPGTPPAPRSEIAVDLLFDGPGPTFGDLFMITGHGNPNFPPPRQFDFAQFTDLQVSQIGDYFGVRALSDVGEDVPIWLFPLVAGRIVDHHPGPFDGLRLTYNVLRNPLSRGDHLVHMIDRLAASLPVTPSDGSGPVTARRIRQDIQAIAEDWAARGIDVGSPAALQIDI